VLIARAEIDGRGPVDVRIAGGRVAAIAVSLDRSPGEPVFDAAGGALLPGLHDHHLHLFAWAAARTSVRCGPPEVATARALGEALARAAAAGPPERWIRGVGYHESVAGDLDRHRLDAWVGGRAARIQHRSGQLWVLSSEGVARLRLDRASHPGIERDAGGSPTGRVFRADAWLRERLGAGEIPSLAEASRELASYGVTSATDATAGNDEDALRRFAEAASRGELAQRLLVMGRAKLPEPRHPRILRDAVKLVLSEADPIPFEALCDAIAEAHAEQRAVAIHCVTRSELVLAAAALDAAGVRTGDRIEHAAVAPPEALAILAGLRVTVVTQPGFIATRGDAYASDVAAADLPHLYRCQGLLDAGIALGGSTDAPFGSPDPWAAMRAAVERRTPEGRVIGAAERVSPERALALFTSPAEAPGGAPRRVVVGADADLCLLARPWAEVRTRLDAADVCATFCSGVPVFRS
jgi:predicted amidohydrolase YtcJ